MEKTALRNMSALCATVLVGVTVLARPCMGQTQVNDQPQTQVSEDAGGLIAGIVVDSKRRLVRGACLQLRPHGMPRSAALVACTDTGYFELPVRLGSYWVSVSDSPAGFDVPSRWVVLTKEEPVRNLTLPFIPQRRRCGEIGCSVLDLLPLQFLDYWPPELIMRASEGLHQSATSIRAPH